jgi:signal peptidase I
VRLRVPVAAATVLAAVVVVRLTALDTIRVSSGSMAPTVCTGDVVMINHLLPASGVEVGGIVTFPRPGDGSEQIKRVVALGGQSVAYVDAASIDGVYFGPVTVPPGSAFVMGDDREISIDSRVFGAVPLGDVDGRLSATLWSACP